MQGRADGVQDRNPAESGDEIGISSQHASYAPSKRSVRTRISRAEYKELGKK